MNCEFCHKPTHIWFDCPIKPPGWRPARLAKKSTAARKDVRVTHLAPEGDTKPERNSGRSLKSVAGTQALPVDPPKRGRPSTGFDKRAYNKQYMADRRAGKR